MKNYFCAMALSLSLGCASAVVRPYIGEQQAWPTASGSIVNTRYNLPIFTSLPPSSYIVLGELRIQSPFYAQPEEGHMPLLVKKAKKLDADAIVFVQGEIFFSTNYGPKPGDAGIAAGGTPTLTQVNRFNPESFKPGVTILAIKWSGEPPAGLPGTVAHAAAPPAAPPTPPSTETPPPPPPAAAETSAPPAAVETTNAPAATTSEETKPAEPPPAVSGRPQYR